MNTVQDKKTAQVTFMIKVLFLFLFTATAKSNVDRASYYGVIQKVDGVAFVSDGRTTIQAREGMRLFDHNEIMTTSMSQVTFMDRYDHLFHLSGEGQVKVNNQLVSLKRGDLWFQSMRSTNDSFALETANSQVIYQTGEGIFSFDESSGRTQLLSLRGRFLFGNPIHDYPAERVSEGHFSFISEDHRDGVPRASRPIGFNSYKKITGLFKNVTPLGGELHFPEVQESRPSRSVASVNESQKSSRSEVTPGRLIYVNSTKVVDQNRDLLREYYQEQMRSNRSDRGSSSQRAPASIEKEKEVSHRSNRGRGVKVRVYGRQMSANNRIAGSMKPTIPKSMLDSNMSQKVESKIEKTVQRDRPTRTPASLQMSSDPFEKRLQQETRSQKRHSDEVNALIRDLRNYRNDFRSSY